MQYGNIAFDESNVRVCMACHWLHSFAGRRKPIDFSFLRIADGQTKLTVQRWMMSFQRVLIMLWISWISRILSPYRTQRFWIVIKDSRVSWRTQVAWEMSWAVSFTNQSVLSKFYEFVEFLNFCFSVLHQHTDHSISRRVHVLQKKIIHKVFIINI